MDEKKVRAWLNLKLAKSITAKNAKNLVEKFGAVELFEDKKDILKQFLDRSSFEEVFSSETNKRIENTLRILSNSDIKFITLTDKEYPQSLKTLYSPPLFILLKGSYLRDKLKPALGVVGTRKLSNYGKMATRKITTELVKSGFSIISGLAYGADAVAHTATLDNNGFTVAVLGTCVNKIYPKVNQKLADRILDLGGSLISENLPDTPAEPWVFPARNRIISGLSQGVLVTEGPIKSGALLTAKFALQQGKNVFAIPGDIFRQQSKGTNYLIKCGAKPVCESKDILEEYGVISNLKRQNKIDLTPEQKIVYELILESRPEISFDKLLIKTSLNIGDLSSILLELEMNNLISKQPGNMISVSF